ncbi:hypothetical protein GY45DRAFT_439015 [Cubamyces sp. BRFM 1775]|nr:hypothetical protein GY45DRAFT_439015 [Cubamyces sp. BRFM 1775]
MMTAVHLAGLCNMMVRVGCGIHPGRQPNCLRKPAGRGRGRSRSFSCACPGDLQLPRDNGSRYSVRRILCSELTWAIHPSLPGFALPTSIAQIALESGKRPSGASHSSTPLFRRCPRSPGCDLRETGGSSIGQRISTTRADAFHCHPRATGHGQMPAPRSGPSPNALLLRRVLGAFCDSLRDAPFQNSYARSTR